MKLIQAALSLLLSTTSSFHLTLPTPTATTHPKTSTSLYGKLWKRLQIEEDPPSLGTQWYLLNCVAGVEFDLLTQARHVTRHFPSDMVEKIVVPTERHLRSHGDTKKVVDVKVRYPGYVFCKIRLTEDVYETLQELELARSWMGTVNRRGYRKLPPAPLPLNQEEVTKFKGLEKESELFEDMFGTDYSGRNDSGEDLLKQYQGYEVGQMVKITKGNFEGEDGTVRRLKGGQLMVRMFTYGQTYDAWMDPDAVRPLSDLEVMRGMTGPTKPIDQHQFDVSIGNKDAAILDDTRDGRASLMSSAGGGAGTRNRRQDRIARGETGRDLFGRTPEDIQREEANWLAYREEKRANQRAVPDAAATAAAKKKKDGPKKGQDTWGIKARSSWDGGEFGFENYVAEERAARKRLEEMYQDRDEFRSYDRNQRGRANRQTFSHDGRGQRSGRDDSRGRGSFGDRQRSRSDFGDRQQAPNTRERRPVRESRSDVFRGGDKFNRSRRVKEEDWASMSRDQSDHDSDDFFSSLMKELKDDVDSSQQRERGTRHHDYAGPNVNSEKSSTDSEDSFFENLMSELGSSLDTKPSVDSDAGGDNDDDFFANLESELSSSLGGETEPTNKASNNEKSKSTFDDDPFFASLESELKSSDDKSKSTNDVNDDDFFASLESELSSSLNQESLFGDDESFDKLHQDTDKSKSDSAPNDDFFSGLIDELADELERTEKKYDTNPKDDPFTVAGIESDENSGKQGLGGIKVVKASKENIGNLDSMTVPQLKDMLKSRGLKVGGRKAELIQRLQSSG